MSIYHVCVDPSIPHTPNKSFQKHLLENPGMTFDLSQCERGTQDDLGILCASPSLTHDAGVMIEKQGALGPKEGHRSGSSERQRQCSHHRM